MWDSEWGSDNNFHDKHATRSRRGPLWTNKQTKRQNIKTHTSASSGRNDYFTFPTLQSEQENKTPGRHGRLTVTDGDRRRVIQPTQMNGLSCRIQLSTASPVGCLRAKTLFSLALRNGGGTRNCGREFFCLGEVGNHRKQENRQRAVKGLAYTIFCLFYLALFS